MSAISILPTITLILGVLGTILFGIATPTEAAGVGAFLAFLLIIAYRRFSWRALKESVVNTGRTTCMVIMVAFGGIAFSTAFLRIGGGEVVSNILLTPELGKWGALLLMLFVFFIGGFLMDWIPIMFIAFPVFIPLAPVLGFELTYLVVLIATLCQTCFLTPPFGYALFYLKGIVPKGIETADIYRGVWPFIIMQLVGVTLCIIFPQIILWLPSIIVGIK